MKPRKPYPLLMAKPETIEGSQSRLRELRMLSADTRFVAVLVFVLEAHFSMQSQESKDALVSLVRQLFDEETKNVSGRRDYNQTLTDVLHSLGLATAP